jgi:hypothetical protein
MWFYSHHIIYNVEMLEKKGSKEKTGPGVGTKQKLVIVDTPEQKKSGGCC